MTHFPAVLEALRARGGGRRRSSSARIVRRGRRGGSRSRRGGDLQARHVDAGDRRLGSSASCGRGVEAGRRGDGAEARARAARRIALGAFGLAALGAFWLAVLGAFWLAVLALAAFEASAPRARTANVETEEQRISRVLQSALVAPAGDVNRCFEKALADTLDVAGKIELSVDVGGRGARHEDGAASTRLKSPVLLACLQQTALTWTLAASIRGARSSCRSPFEGQNAQFTVKVADAPERGPGTGAPGARRARKADAR